MKTVFAIALIASLVAVASAATLSHDEVFAAFNMFAAKHGKTYESETEFKARMAIFQANLERAEELNMEQIMSGGEAAHGITKFMDLTPTEFRRMYKMTNYTAMSAGAANVFKAEGAVNAADIDWRSKGVLTPVKNQEQCGSCWAFSATQAIESYSFMAGKPLNEYAEQQIVSCDTTSYGCNGGWSEHAYKYVMGAGGLELNKDYPYSSGGGVTGTCKVDTSKIVKDSLLTGYTSVTKNDYNSLLAATMKGPVSICLAADAFQTYTGGILTSCAGQVDHCVQMAGWMSEQGGYWIVRNSWGADWGNAGFIYIKSGSNLCQIQGDATFPLF